MARHVPPPLEAVPQFRGHGAGVCGATAVSALVGDEEGCDVVATSIGQLSQATGQSPVKCGHRTAWLSTVIALQGVVGSGLPLHVITLDVIGGAVGEKVSSASVEVEVVGNEVVGIEVVGSEVVGSEVVGGVVGGGVGGVVGGVVGGGAGDGVGRRVDSEVGLAVAVDEVPAWVRHGIRSVVRQGCVT